MLKDKNYIFRNKHNKIVLEIWKDTLIQIYEKGDLLMSSISIDNEEFEEDVEIALKLIKNKCARKWFRKTIKNYYGDN